MLAQVGFLNKVANNTGLFLGMTGAIFNAVDALTIGLANIAISSRHKSDVIANLSDVAWQSNSENYKLLDEALSKFVLQSEQYLQINSIECS